MVILGERNSQLRLIKKRKQNVCLFQVYKGVRVFGLQYISAFSIQTIHYSEILRWKLNSFSNSRKFDVGHHTISSQTPLIHQSWFITIFSCSCADYSGTTSADSSQSSLVPVQSSYRLLLFLYNLLRLS